MFLFRLSLLLDLADLRGKIVTIAFHWMIVAAFHDAELHLAGFPVLCALDPEGTANLE